MIVTDEHQPAGRAAVRPGADGRGVVQGRPLQRPSTSETLANELRRQILSGAVGPGTRLREMEIADAFGVSRQSLRAALAELVHEGLLRRAPHRGVWVPALTAEELRDIYDLRGVLEAEAASRLAREPGRVGPVRAELDRLSALDADTSWGLTQEAHLAFHRAMVDAAGSPRLSRAYSLLWSEVSLGLVAARDHPSSAPGGLAATHRALLDQILAGPPNVAGLAAREHLTIGLGTALAAAVGEHG
jgi:DNA-binding GntR family transcriptional regulator